MKLTEEQQQYCIKRYEREIRYLKVKRMKAPAVITEAYEEMIAKVTEKCKELGVTDKIYLAFCEKYHEIYIANEIEHSIRQSCLKWLRHIQNDVRGDKLTICKCVVRNNGCRHDCPEIEPATEQQQNWFKSCCDVDTGEFYETPNDPPDIDLQE